MSWYEVVAVSALSAAAVLVLIALAAILFWRYM
jgi:hypothetical protein